MLTRALEFVESAIDLDKLNCDAYILKANVYEKEGKIGDAVKVLKDFI